MSAEQPSSSEPKAPEPSELSSDAVADIPFDESEFASDAVADIPFDQTDQTEPDLRSVEPLESADTIVSTASDQAASNPELAEPSVEVEPLPPDSVDGRSTPVQRPAPTNDEILPQTLLRLGSEAVVAAQPLVKQQGIKALKGTIRLLERAVERLEAEPAPKQPPEQAPSSTPPASTQSRPGKRTQPTETETLQGRFQMIGRQVWRSWQSVLRQVRDRLPASIRRKWSDQTLTGAIAGSVVLLLWATSTLLPDQPPLTTVATAPPTETVVASPSPSPTPIPIPPLVKAPEAPKSIESSPPPVVPSPPPPPLKLTPEQTLIARIQNQVAAISGQYADGLVESVQANFRSSRLIVHISNGWYGLSRSQQDKLASEILNRTQNLDFLKLELVDGAGKLLARSPVVGSEMIILRRTAEAVEAA